MRGPKLSKRDWGGAGEARGRQVAAAAERPGAVADDDVGREGQDLRRAQRQERLADGRLALGQLRPLHQGDGDQLRQRDGVGDDRRGDDPAVIRREPHGGVEAQDLAKPCGGGQLLVFRLDEFGLAFLQVGRGPVGVRLPALAGGGEAGRDAGDLARFVARLHGDGVVGVRLQQRDVAVGRLEQDVVGDGRAGELTFPHDLAGDEPGVNGFGDVAAPHQAGNVDRSGADGVGAQAEVHGAAVDLLDDADGSLQGAGVRVHVEAGVERRQELGDGELMLRDRLGDALPRQQDLGILHAGQLQHAGQVDGRRRGVEDGRGRRRQLGFLDRPGRVQVRRLVGRRGAEEAGAAEQDRGDHAPPRTSGGRGMTPWLTSQSLPRCGRARVPIGEVRPTQAGNGG